MDLIAMCCKRAQGLCEARGAEEIAFHGVVSTGAADDLQKASELLRQMVTRFGMSERMGQLTYERPQISAFLPTTASLDDRLYSHNTAEMIDDEVRTICDHIYHRVQSILRRRLEDLQVVAERSGRYRDCHACSYQRATLFCMHASG
ncbi:MAG: hypothetical protein ACJ746_06150 [Bryobacteraceae bacterium]